MNDKWGAKNYKGLWPYEGDGPATMTSLSLKQKDFVSLPIEVTYLVTLQELSLYECKKLETLPEGVPPMITYMNSTLNLGVTIGPILNHVIDRRYW